MRMIRSIEHEWSEIWRTDLRERPSFWDKMKKQYYQETYLVHKVRDIQYAQKSQGLIA